MRKLRLWHEEFLRSLAARLSIYLRLDVGLRMSNLHAIPYQQFIDGLATPTCLTLFKAEPLRGVCVLDLPTRLGLTFVDRLLGGSAQAITARRDLSEIEAALLDQAVQLMLGEWCSLWKDFPELKPVLLGHETNGQFLQLAARDSLMLVLVVEARLGDCVDQMQIGFPCSTLEPLLGGLNLSFAPQASQPAQVVTQPVRWNPALDNLKLPVSAEWHGMEITVREIARLKVGDVLELNPDSVNQVQLRLAGTAKFLGRLGTRDNRWGVEITQVFKSERNA